MLGELLGENTGQRIVRRVLETNPPTVEVSFEENGKMLGATTSGFGTYTSVVKGQTAPSMARARVRCSQRTEKWSPGKAQARGNSGPLAP